MTPDEARLILENYLIERVHTLGEMSLPSVDIIVTHITTEDQIEEFSFIFLIKTAYNLK